MDPSEEDRLKEIKGEGLVVAKNRMTIPKKFSKLFSSLDQEVVGDSVSYLDTLKEIVNPPVVPDLNEQIIKEGLRLSPEVAPKCAVLLSEAIPSWLPVIDGWGTDRLFMYCESEERWYRNNLELKTPLSMCLTVAGLAKGMWIKEVNKVVLVQGSSAFCKKMVNGLSSIGITQQTKLIVTSNEKCRNLKLSFKFLRLSHSKLGGATNTITSIGFTKACNISNETTFVSGIPATVLDHICPMTTGTIYDPLIDHTTTRGDVTKFLNGKAIYPIRAIATGTFIVPAIFSNTNWVSRKLSNAEILSIMDFPVQLNKRVNENDLDIQLSEIIDILELVIPVKTLQEATRLLFDWDVPIERPHEIPLYDINRLGFKIDGLDQIYEEINQS